MSPKKKQSTLTEELLSFIERLHQRSVDITDELNFSKKEKAQMYSAGLYTSILELTQAFLILIKSGSYIAIPATVRSLLETYVDLLNIHKNKDYVRNMEAQQAEAQLKTFKRAQGGKNPYLAEIAKMKDFARLLKESQDSVDEFKKNKIATLNIRERFAKVSLDPLYEGVYSFLSRNTHSSISAIFYRHFEKDGKGFAIVHQKDLSSERLMPYLDTIASLLLDVSNSMHETYGAKDKAMFKRFQDELAQIRKKYAN